MPRTNLSDAFKSSLKTCGMQRYNNHQNVIMIIIRSSNSGINSDEDNHSNSNDNHNNNIKSYIILFVEICR